MCTNFTPTVQRKAVISRFGVEVPDAFPPEAYPGFHAPLIVRSLRTGRVACGLAKFGLIPAWAKDDKIARHTYNARSETAAEKPSFRTAWRNRQFGLLMVDNFFEPSYASGKAIRWKITTQPDEPFGIACLWDRWIDPNTGEQIASFSMLTVNADQHPVMSQFHRAGDEKRTPVILNANQYEDWLAADEPVARAMMNWHNMPELKAEPAPTVRL